MSNMRNIKIDQALIDLINAKRRQKGIDKPTLASAAGVSYANTQAIVSGKRKMMTWSTFQKIDNVLEFTSDEVKAAKVKFSNNYSLYQHLENVVRGKKIPKDKAVNKDQVEIDFSALDSDREKAIVNNRQIDLPDRAHLLTPESWSVLAEILGKLVDDLLDAEARNRK